MRPSIRTGGRPLISAMRPAISTARAMSSSDSGGSARDGASTSPIGSRSAARWARIASDSHTPIGTSRRYAAASASRRSASPTPRMVQRLSSDVSDMARACTRGARRAR